MKLPAATTDHPSGRTYCPTFLSRTSWNTACRTSSAARFNSSRKSIPSFSLGCRFTAAFSFWCPCSPSRICWASCALRSADGRSAGGR